MHEVERALFDLQRGRPLLVTSPGSSTAVLAAAVEGLSRRALDELRGHGSGCLRLVVTRHRALAMRLGFDAAAGASLGVNGATGPDEIMCLARARRNDTAKPLDVREASASELGAVTLARLGRLLPAVVGATVEASLPALGRLVESGAVLRVTTAQIQSMAESTELELVHVSDGPVPLEEAENARVMLFREASGLHDHVAIVIGSRETWPDAVPVRLHSACLTGDLFGSLRCDCGAQLRGSLRVFAERGGGVLVYLAQEGRGIGLGNKLRAYELQEEGLDTEEADSVLGFGADERRYDSAIAILRYLGIDRIQLLTNNPAKVRALTEAGIDVIDRQPLYGTLNPHNVRYVATKARAGHWLEDMLSGVLSGK